MEDEERLLFAGTNLENVLSPAETLTIQAKLWDVLAKRAESYTMGGSSSVCTEAAQELLRSAAFVIRHGLARGWTMDANHSRENTPEALKARLLGDDYDTLLKSGLKAIEALVREGEALLESANKTAIAVENLAYHNTLKELGVFFKRYHYHHFAHNIPCMLDYPLACPVNEALLGIDYINEYLRRLLIENDFCSRFDAGTVTALLRSAAPDYRDNLLNIYETVAANALSLTLLGGDVKSLDVTERDIIRLYALLCTPAGSIASEFRSAAFVLCDVLKINGAASKNYLADTAEALGAQVSLALHTKRLVCIFPPLYREEAEEEKQVVTFIDNAPMDNEKLRALIDEITSCHHVSDKIALARQHAGSLRDWAEILGICFWGDELKALFMSFSEVELDLLLRFVREKQQKYPEWISETGWETAFTEFKRESEA